MLLVLETLPRERAVFLLREVFDVPYDEIAEAVDPHPGRRAPDRPPGPRARGRPPSSPAGRPRRARRRPRAVRAAADTGDLQALVDVLAPDVLLVTDGGGVRKAALRPILGRDKVLRFLEAVTPQDVDVEFAVSWSAASPAWSRCSTAWSTASSPSRSSTGWSARSTSCATPTS